MSGCGAIYVLLGETPEQDRLERCTRDPAWTGRTGHCAEHQHQLGWVAASFPRQVAYRQQVAHYQRLTATTPAVEQASLMDASH